MEDFDEVINKYTAITDAARMIRLEILKQKMDAAPFVESKYIEIFEEVVSYYGFFDNPGTLVAQNIYDEFSKRCADWYKSLSDFEKEGLKY